MYAHNVQKRLARALVAPRFAAGVVVTLALLSAACSNDSASRIMAPPLLSSMNKGSGSNSGSSGAAGDFAVLAGPKVTCTTSSVTGNVGTNQAPPTGSVVRTLCDITGSVHVGDGVAKAAYLAFLDRYAALAPKTGDVCTTFPGVTPSNTITASETVFPGVYCTPAALTATDVTLTLDAQGDPNAVWIFKIGTLGTGALSGTNFSVVMAGLGNPCNVTWWVAQAATIKDVDAGVSHPFVGTILAGADITTTGGAGAPTNTNRLSFTGNAFAKAAVTMTDTNLTGCAATQNNGHHKGKNHKDKCNQGVGNGSEGCDPGKSNHHNSSNDEHGGTPGNPGRKGGNN
jgi:hypothetical protein